MKNNFKLLIELIKKSQKILITTHAMPDADGIGSEVALYLALKSIGKKVFCVNEQNISNRWKGIVPQDIILSHREYLRTLPNPKIDLMIIVDANSPNRIGIKMLQLLVKSKNFICLDHHPTSKQASILHCIDTSASATGELVGRLLLQMKIKITHDMALALYSAIVIDTSCFRYPTVTSYTHYLISKLLKVGPPPAEIYQQVYGAKKVAHLKLLGEILAKTEVNIDQSLAWLSISSKKLNQYRISDEDTNYFINHLLVLDKVKVVLMFKEWPDSGPGYVKVSFRSNGHVDVGEIASALGGGGHNHSAAAIIQGSLKNVIKSTISKIQLFLSKSFN